MSLGDFTAFNSYLAILIFPVIMIGFMSNVMAQAERVLHAHRHGARGAAAEAARARSAADLRGDIALSHVVAEVRREGRR